MSEQKTTTWWRVNIGGLEPTAVEVLKETDQTLLLALNYAGTVSKFRVQKRTSGIRFFATKNEAWKWLEDYYRHKADAAHNEAHDALSKFMAVSTRFIDEQAIHCDNRETVQS